MGSWKLLGWLAGIGMGEVRGAQAKNQGAQAFFMKILYTKKKKIWTQGGAGPPLPSAWVRPWLDGKIDYNDLKMPIGDFESKTSWILLDLENY